MNKTQATINVRIKNTNDYLFSLFLWNLIINTIKFRGETLNFKVITIYQSFPEKLNPNK